MTISSLSPTPATELTTTAVGWPDASDGPALDAVHGDVLADALIADLDVVADALDGRASELGSTMPVLRALVVSVCELDPGVRHSRLGDADPADDFTPWSPALVDEDADGAQRVWDVTLFVPLRDGDAVRVRLVLLVDEFGDALADVDVDGAPVLVDFVTSTVAAVIGSGVPVP